jgi:hypothetical protein
MFFAIVFIALGLFLLLSALGILSADFWGLFWGLVFLGLGLKLLMKRGKCPICGWGQWGGKMHDKMHGRCCEGHDHENQN